jgi:hypothetical protein
LTEYVCRIEQHRYTHGCPERTETREMGKLKKYKKKEGRRRREKTFITYKQF